MRSLAYRRRKKPRWIIPTLYGFFLLMVAACATFAGWVNRGAPAIAKAVLTETIQNRHPQDVFGTKAINVLILGCDDDFQANGTVSSDHGRSDMMMLVRFDFQNQRLTGLSIPRDTLMRLPALDDKVHKINVFHARGGPPMSAKAVESLIKVKVDRVARLNFVAFVDAVNLLGGVEIQAKKPLEYTDHSDGLYIRIKKGLNRLNGYGALGFVRFRHDDSDFARQERQHEFVAAMRARMVAHPTEALRMTDKLIPLLNGAFNTDEMAALIRFGIGLKSQDIKLSSVPTVTLGGTVLVNRKALPQALKEFDFTPELGDPADGSPDGKPADTEEMGAPSENPGGAVKLSQAAPNKEAQTHVAPDHPRI